MPLTRQIPSEAQPVVDVLRRDVPRPTKLPRPAVKWGECLRWGPCCAAGLHLRSRKPVPYHAWEWCDDEITDRCFMSFWKWHDEQTDPAALVDAIWPLDAAKQKG